MKRLSVLAIFVMIVLSAPAQSLNNADTATDRSHYGTIPVVNGKVTFVETVPATGRSAQEVKEIIDSWIEERFVEPTVISARRLQSDKPATAILKGEEYITFKSTAFALERARIYYILTLTAKEGSCTFNMSRITYWYDDADERGGLRMIAEEWITDENAINKKGGLKKFEGKFRNKTIDLKETLVKELEIKLKLRKNENY